MLDILRMAKNEELAVKMIFPAEQPLTGMNEGTWFPRRMCRRIEGILCREGENEFLQFTVGRSVSYRYLQVGVLPTTEQICCTVGSIHLQEAFERGIAPTAKCRKCRKCKKGKKKGNPSNVDYPSKQ